MQSAWVAASPFARPASASQQQLPQPSPPRLQRLPLLLPLLLPPLQQPPPPRPLHPLLLPLRPVAQA